MAEEFCLTADARVATPAVSGQVKQRVEDFRVFELLNIDIADEGEHVLLHIRKQQANTDQVAKALAKFAGIPYRDVGYSGLKDHFAVTEQWFSVRLAGKDEPDWHSFNCNGTTILEIRRHNRKLKRGTHRANRFEIRIRQLSGDLSALSARLNEVQQYGVPNYFGEQRFGRDGGNIQQAVEFFQGRQKVKSRALRSILLSSARSLLFNQVVSERVAAGSWNQLMPDEPANLNGTNSFFTSRGLPEEQARLAEFDIHPSAPLWGRVDSDFVAQFQSLHDWEVTILERHPVLLKGLEEKGLSYQRRATRIELKSLQWEIEDDQLALSFELSKGQFATSVLRELIFTT